MRLQKWAVIAIVALAAGCGQSGPTPNPDDYVVSVPGMH